MVVHLVDGTYELFRHFYGLRSKSVSRRNASPEGAAPAHPLSAAAGVLGTIVQMIAEGATHIAVATDHVIESFRNTLWHGYKTGEGIDPALWAQFHPLEEFLIAMGVQTFAMVDLEADDALASAARLASRDARVEKVCIWTPDKDLAQCVVGHRVVQVDRRSGEVRDQARVLAKFGVAPAFIPDYLALVGDSADGYPGIAGIGGKTAARLIVRHGHLEQFPDSVLGENRPRALLFKTLATLRTDAPVFEDVEQLRWTGPTAAFPSVVETIGSTRLAERVKSLSLSRGGLYSRHDDQN